jgi:hypothetical protein
MSQKKGHAKILRPNFVSAHARAKRSCVCLRLCLRPHLTPSGTPQGPAREISGRERSNIKQSAVHAPPMEEARTPRFFKVLVGDFARRIVSSTPSSSCPCGSFPFRCLHLRDRFGLGAARAGMVSTCTSRSGIVSVPVCIG